VAIKAYLILSSILTLEPESDPLFKLVGQIYNIVPDILLEVCDVFSSAIGFLIAFFVLCRLEGLRTHGVSQLTRSSDEMLTYLFQRMLMPTLVFS
jgi:hypothetical protein